MRFYSPLRYPGGKACLSDFLDDVIYINDLQGCRYFEPYAGGAGAALGLLMSGAVSEIILNDADIRIFAFWNSLLSDWGRFAERVHDVSVTLEEWQKQREICNNPNKFSQFEVGFSTFFMNRCNRSGIISGGPIGGFSQSGKWRLDVRFNKEELVHRLANIGKNKDRIQIYNMDAIDFLKTTLPRSKGRDRVLVYLDPPYVVKARRLYMNSYKDKDHEKLSDYIVRQSRLKWIMSYDYCQLVINLYNNDCSVNTLPIKYSLSKKVSTKELLISPQNVRLPISTVEGSNNCLVEALSNGGTYV
jgi:DNA adenine methylase